MIKIYLRDNKKKWDEQLPKIKFSLNTAVQESNGFSPAEMNIGRNLKPPKSIFEDQTRNFSRPVGDFQYVTTKNRRNSRNCWEKLGESYKSRQAKWHLCLETKTVKQLQLGLHTSIMNSSGGSRLFI